MNWNNSMHGSGPIRTTFHVGGNLGSNRLATGFRPQSERPINEKVSKHDVIEISDDSDMEDDSEGGILLNVDAAPRLDSSVEVEIPAKSADGEDGEIEDDHSNPTMPSAQKTEAGRRAPAPESSQNATAKPASQNKHGDHRPMFQIDARRGARILADLNPEELETQIRYTLFHLPRDQIDLSRPVICVGCLSEGHTDQYCPALLCSSCGGQTRHTSRLCPQRARCSRCGDRGHQIKTCKAKLKNASLEPCEFCGGDDHVEPSCSQRFFPPRSELPVGSELRLWISCAQCGSKNHLAGDCSIYSSKPAHAWSLRDYSRNKIINLSLHTGTQVREKEAQSKGIRPEGMQIRGHRNPSSHKYPKREGDPACFSGPRSEDEDDFTSRIAGNRSRRPPPPPRTHIRFDDDDRGRMNHGGRDDYYRVRSSNKSPPSHEYDSHHPFPSHEHRERNGYRGGRNGYEDDWDHRNRRPRSRSPPWLEGGDNWRPPLPREPPPAASLPVRPAAVPRGQQQPHNPTSNSVRKARRAAGNSKGNGTGGGIAVKPMPSAAQNAWNRGRM